MAPGVNIVSLAAPGSRLFNELAHLRVPDANGSPQYFMLSGTSMAAPAVAAAAALLLRENHDLSANTLKLALQFTARIVPLTDVLSQGAGALNIAGALTLADAINPNARPGTNWIRHRITAANTDANESVHRVGPAHHLRQPLHAAALRAGAPAALERRCRLGVRRDCRQHRLGEQRRRQHRVGQRGQHRLGQPRRRKTVWGTGESDNAVWGIDDNIVWGNAGNIVWGNSADDNIVWGNGVVRGVWASNVVSGFWDDNIVWGNVTRRELRQHRLGQPGRQHRLGQPGRLAALTRRR